MIFPIVVTLLIVSPVAGFIVAYQCLYLHMPCVGIDNVHRIGIEQDAVEIQEVDVGVEQDNNIIFFNNNIRVQEDINIEQDNIEQDNNIRVEEVAVGVD